MYNVCRVQSRRSKPYAREQKLAHEALPICPWSMSAGKKQYLMLRLHWYIFTIFSASIRQDLFACVHAPHIFCVPRLHWRISRVEKLACRKAGFSAHTSRHDVGKCVKSVHLHWQIFCVAENAQWDVSVWTKHYWCVCVYAYGEGVMSASGT